VKPDWEKSRKRFKQGGIALILLAPIPFLIFLSIHEPGSFGILSYLLPALSFGAVALGVLFIFLGAACLLFITRSAREDVKCRPALREETRLRIILIVAVVAVLFAYALLALAFLMLINGVPETTLDTTLAIPIGGIRSLVVPILYLLLFLAWIALLQRRRAIAKAAPPDKPGQPEDGEE
jgi:hypothetical protein